MRIWGATTIRPVSEDISVGFSHRHKQLVSPMNLNPKPRNHKTLHLVIVINLEGSHSVREDKAPTTVAIRPFCSILLGLGFRVPGTVKVLPFCAIPLPAVKAPTHK